MTSPGKDSGVNVSAVLNTVFTSYVFTEIEEEALSSRGH